MATEVFTTEEIALLDGTEVEIRPLPIAKLRKFMKLWNAHMAFVTKKINEEQAKPEDERDFDSDEVTDAQYDVFIKMCALGLESELKEKDETDKKFLARLEEILDEKTIYKILEVTGSLKLGGDPNQRAASLAEAGMN